MGASASAQSVANQNFGIIKSKSNSTDQFIHNDKHDKHKTDKSIQLLLLGPSESGKSTLTKQLRILYEQDFEDSDRSDYKDVIRQNLIHILSCVQSAMVDMQLDIPNEHKDMLDSLQQLAAHNNTDTLLCYSSSIIKFISSTCYQMCMNRRWDYDFPSSTSYFTENVKRILNPAFTPTNEDILRARVNTYGLHETCFHFKDVEFTVFDVGSKRSEPRKWIHYFDNVSALIYTLDISCYDRQVIDDVHGAQNQLRQSIHTLKSVINNPTFRNTTIIVFLNKQDLFKEKLRHVSLHRHFPQYTGSDDYQESSRFIQQQITESNTDYQREMYTHLTCAIDSQNIRQLFDNIISIILQQGLTTSHLY